MNLKEDANKENELVNINIDDVSIKENTTNEETTKLEEKLTSGKNSNVRKKINIITITLFVIACIIATILIYPYITRLGNDDAYRMQFEEKIDELGILGILLIIAIFVVQAILAVLPSFVFETIAGLMYGTFAGVVFCLIGSTLGSVIVILLVRILGSDFANKFVDMSSSKKYKLLDVIDDVKRTELIIFSILLMPGMPKDFIAFFVPFTKVKIRKYIVINIVARIPSTIVTAMLGNAIRTGDSKLAIILLICTIIVSLLVFIFNKQIVNFLNRKKKKAMLNA